MPSRIACTASGVERSTSVSSIRRMKMPPWWRANAQENSAVRAPPMWRKPVGDGAKRVRTVGSGMDGRGSGRWGVAARARRARRSPRF